MAKWNFRIVGNSLVKELVPVDGDVEYRSQSFMEPSFDLEGDKIVIKESGAYKSAVSFSQIGEIDGVEPTDIQDAYDKLLTLVQNFNGGGATPQLTQDELDAIQGSNSPSASNVFATMADLGGASSTREIVIREDVQGNYTFGAGDERKLFIVLCTGPSNLTYTIPEGVFSVGDQLMVRMLNPVNSTITYTVQRSTGSVVQYGKDESLSVITFFEPSAGQNYWAFNYIPSSGLSSALSLKQDNLTAANMHTYIDGLVALTTPVDADRMIIVDNSASLAKKITWANIKSTLKTYFDAIYTTASAVATQISNAIAPATAVTFNGSTVALDKVSGTAYSPYTQVGILSITVAGGSTVLGFATIAITANGSAITVPAGWRNVGSDAISTVNGNVNRFIITQMNTEVWYTVKVN